MSEIIKFVDNDFVLNVQVSPEEDTVWLSRMEIAELFEKDIKTIGKHVNNIFKDEELEKESVVANFATTALDGKVYNVDHYNLDMIISVGYRVKSKRGILFRKWANKILKDYMLQGYAINQRALNIPIPDYNKMIKELNDYKAMNGILDITADDILGFLISYDNALQMLDKYDHLDNNDFEGIEDTVEITYEECQQVIKNSNFTGKNDLFGIEKDESFKGSIASIYQTFGGIDLYPTLEEKASQLLYNIVKNHSFVDGNKRIAVITFLYFLNQNKALIINGKERVNGNTMATLAILIATSKPEDKASIINLILMLLG